MGKCKCRLTEAELFEAHGVTPTRIRSSLDERPPAQEPPPSRADTIRAEYAARNAERILSDLRRQERRQHVAGRIIER